MPNDDYIKRSDARAYVRHAHGKGLNLMECIDAIPAADVEPVKHGHWVWKMREFIRYEDVTGTDPLGGTQTVTVKTHVRGPVPYCSLCDALAADSFLDYCPHCGAKMDAEPPKEEEEESHENRT